MFGDFISSVPTLVTHILLPIKIGPGRIPLCRINYLPVAGKKPREEKMWFRIGIRPSSRLMRYAGLTARSNG